MAEILQLVPATTAFMKKDFGTEIKIFEDFRTFFTTVFDQLSLTLSLSLCLPLSLPLRGITTRNIQFIQLCEIVSDGKLNQKLLETLSKK